MPALSMPPMPGPKGQEVLENVSQEAWELWKSHQTTLINEKHLDMSDPENRLWLIDQMDKFFCNEDYEKVVNYWKGNGPQPTTEEARRGLFQMAEDLAIEKNTLRPDLIASLFSNQFGTTNKPYTNIEIPGQIFAVDYDIGNQGVSYSDTEYKQVSSDENQNTGNNGWSYRNDGVDIESCSDPTIDYNIGWIETGEWLEYTVNITKSGSYTTKAIIASTGAGKMRIKVNGKQIGSDLDVPDTGGYQNWGQINFGQQSFNAGEALVRVEILEGDFSFAMISID